MSEKAEQGGAFNRQQQQQILRRFEQINASRLARLYADLDDAQSLFLEALPALLHSNQAKLPGFVADYTPSGLCRYEISTATLERLQKAFPALDAALLTQNKQQLLGLYLVGDSNSLMTANNAQLKIFLCHRNNLAANEVSALKRKCLLLSHFAAASNLSVHFKIFNASQILPALALDEFYQSSIVLAGCTPLWWQVPPEEEARYEQFVSLLRHKQYVLDDEVVDFGPITQIPAKELLSAGLHLLSSVNHSPYALCFKQAIHEIYINHSNNNQLLSAQFKQAVYQGNTDIERLDSAINAYQAVENYLKQRNENNRLELIRRCFYFQAGETLSQHQSRASWQYKALQQLTKLWGWNADKLKNLDARSQWKADTAKTETLELAREIGNSYRFLSEFARANKNQCDLPLLHNLSVLGRKLHARYERKAGKIDCINLPQSDNLAEENLYFCQVKHRAQTVWAVYAEPVSLRNSATALPLRRHESLVELLAWCHVNGLCTTQTELHIIEGEHQLKINELKQLLSTVQAALTEQSPLLKPSDSAFEHLARPCQVHIFVNLGIDLSSNKDKRIHSLTTTFDFQGTDNTIVNLETLTLNSWGEVVCKTYSGSIALLNCLRDYMQSAPPQSQITPPKPDFYCFSGPQCQNISARLNELFNDLVACYYNSKMPAATRYVLQMKNQFFIIQYNNNKTNFKGARSEAELLRRLSQPQISYSPVVFDRYALSHSALAAICMTAQKDKLQVYYHDNQDNSATVYIIDSKGSIYHRNYPFSNQQNLLKPIDTFLQCTLYRQSLSQSLANQSDYINHDHHIETEVLYYHIQDQSNGAPKIYPIALNNQLGEQRYFSVQAIAEAGPNNKPIFTIYCDQQEFSSVDWGDGLYPAIARFIMSRRRSGGTYPCYISDLDLSGVGAADGSHHAQVIDYLQYQEQLENGINEALTRL